MHIRKTAFLILILSFSVFAKSQTVAEVLAKYIAYTGGEAHWKNVQTIVISGTYTYGGMAFPFTSYSKRPDRYKFVVPFGGKYFAQAFDGKQGWKIDAFKGETKKTILTGTPARAMLNEADVALEPPFMAYGKKGHQAILEGEDTASGVRCYKVTFIQATGETETYFFDVKNGALLKKTAVSKNSELEGAVLQTVYSDYRTVNGIRLPFKAASSANGQMVLVIVLKKVLFNKPLPDKLFAP